MELHERLTSLRKNKGISQETIAEQMNVSRQAVSKWETGVSQPELPNILKLCEILEVDPNILLDYPEAPQKAEDQTKKKASPKAKIILALLLVLCLAAGIWLGWLLHYSIHGEGGVNKTEPLETLDIAGFELYTIKNTETAKTVKVCFVSSRTDPGDKYTLTATDLSGKIATYPIQKENGVCTAEIELLFYHTPVMLTVHLEKNRTTYAKKLATVTDINPVSCNWTEAE